MTDDEHKEFIRDNMLSIRRELNWIGFCAYFTAVIALLILILK